MVQRKLVTGYEDDLIREALKIKDRSPRIRGRDIIIYDQESRYFHTRTGITSVTVNIVGEDLRLSLGIEPFEAVVDYVVDQTSVKIKQELYRFTKLVYTRPIDSGPVTPQWQIEGELAPQTKRDLLVGLTVAELIKSPAFNSNDLPESVAKLISVPPQFKTKVKVIYVS